jgi:hypothetical protein
MAPGVLSLSKAIRFSKANRKAGICAEFLTIRSKDMLTNIFWFVRASQPHSEDLSGRTEKQSLKGRNLFFEVPRRTNSETTALAASTLLRIPSPHGMSLSKGLTNEPNLA